ncbi:MAG: hypothetical protein BWY82_01591 [Verrucomicrobia bacterium ADurb.Bin474]|nr:MAG: hypothetical protein BWY82_01591 [Verrucomicrobia bacterium ADurb.Bin474]
MTSTASSIANPFATPPRSKHTPASRLIRPSSTQETRSHREEALASAIAASSGKCPTRPASFQSMINGRQVTSKAPSDKANTDWLSLRILESVGDSWIFSRAGAELSLDSSELSIQLLATASTNRMRASAASKICSARALIPRSTTTRSRHSVPMMPSGRLSYVQVGAS